MKKYLLYMKKHWDFILFDLITLIAGYYLVVQFRYAIDDVFHGELFFAYGVVLSIVYLVVLVFSQNLDGIIKRSIVREVKYVFIQTTVSWAMFTVVLYGVKSAQQFSRTVYGTAYIICTILIIIERFIVRSYVRYSRYHNNLAPNILVVCDGDHSEEAIRRILPGFHSNSFNIIGVVMTDTYSRDYNEYFPHTYGIGNLESFLLNKKVDEAFIELENPDVEREVIHTLLNHNIMVHRSLGNSKFNYVEQDIAWLAGHSVVTIKDTHLSVVTRAENFERKLLKKLSKDNKDK